MTEERTEHVVEIEVTEATLSFGDLAKGQGFTPIFDHILEKYGLHRARVYGLVARMDKRTDGYCFMAVPNMAKMLRMEKRNVQTYLRELVEAGEMFAIERNSGQGKTNIYTTSRKTYELLCGGGSVPSTPPGSVPSTSPLKHTTKRLYVKEETIDKDRTHDDVRDSSLKENLSQIGFTPSALQTLVASAGQARVEEVLVWALEGAKLGKVHDPPAWLTDAIREDYPEPKWLNGGDSETERARRRYQQGQFADFWDE